MDVERNKGGAAFLLLAAALAQPLICNIFVRGRDFVAHSRKGTQLA
jgi:hypothetical protein